MATSTSPKTIAMFGTTGFLGPNILSSLLAAHTQTKFICINRSADGEQRTLSKFENIGRDVNRLHFFQADITAPRLGLSPELESLLIEEVDEVVFNAWNPNWGLPLKAFDSLLGSVHSAIEFCTSSPRQPRITFVSSICSIGEWPVNHPESPMIPEEVAWDMNSAMVSGYGQSKCLAEQLFARAHTEKGLRVAIVRAGQIAGPTGHNGVHSVWPLQGWLYSIIKASSQLGQWPTHVQPLDWIPVDLLAQGIANITRTSPDDRSVQVFNMVHPEPAPWQLFYKTLRNRFGLEAMQVGLPQWLERLTPQAFKLYGFLRAAEDGREFNMAFDTRRALQVLPPVPALTEGQVAAWLKGWNLRLGNIRARL